MSPSKNKEDTMKTEIVNLIETYLKEITSEFPVGLNQREKAVLALRGQGKTLQSIGDIMKITRERVRQIETMAKEKILMNAKLAENLYERIAPYYITEGEIETAFLTWYSDVMGKDYLEGKVKFQDLLSMIWTEKQKK